MAGKSVILIAVLVYAAVLGCVMWPEKSASSDPAGVLGAPRRSHGGGASSASRPAIQGLPFVGAGMQIQRVDWIDKYETSIDEIADLGGDTVLFVIDTRMEGGTSCRIYLDMRMMPTPEKLGQLIQHAKKRNLRVILMPIVLLDNPIGDEWRGRIAPNEDRGGWEEWFSSYRQMLNHFSWIAQANGVDVLVVGSELVSSETHDDQWRATIRGVREVFKGQLTYSSNWDHYTAVGFWDELDLIGMNSYWTFGKGKWKRGMDKDVTPEIIASRWKAIQSDLLPFIKKTGKPLLFLEVGWCSMANMSHEPWDYTRTPSEAPTDVEMQKKLYEGFFNSWWGNPHLGGFMIWEWTPGDGGPEDRGYTPENKPAEEVLKQWMAKPRWKVE